MPDRFDPAPEAAPASELRRRWREGWIILATALAVVAFAVFETRLPQFASAGSVGTDAILVLLINLNLILLVLLVFLVGRNVVKLFLDRRRNILGSHLRTRLVVAFIGIALLPATLLFLVAQVFVGNSIEDWFNGQVETALEGSLDVAHAYYEDVATTSLGFARKTAARLAGTKLLQGDARAQLKAFLAERRDEYQLDLMEVFADGKTLGRSRRADLQGKVGVEPWSDLVRRASAGDHATAVDAVGQGDVIRAAAPIEVDGKIVGVVVVDEYVPKSVVKRREQIDRSFGEYLRLKIQRRPIRTAYTITLVLVTMVVLFSAIWVGFYVARGITVPIQRLAEGTRAVALGDLDQYISGEGDDEIGTLVTAFNHMTADLKTSRAELDERNRDLEVVLANITAGVISADGGGRITTMNRAAEGLLGVDAASSVGRPIGAVFTGEPHADLRTELADLLGAGDPLLERQITLVRDDGVEMAVLITGTRLETEGGESQGIVLFLEDVSHLLRVERMEAWREVARRIAHEIKNPLTPIQLAAQRLRRRYGAQLRENGAVFDECTRTIIQQVDELKNLVNEFSTFARMPQGEHTPQALNQLVDEALVLFREGHREVDFTFDAATDLPVLELDREGLKRAVINILDNAVAACAARTARSPGERRRVDLRTVRDERLGIVRLEIADDGVGMSAEAKLRLFEPYYSTKPDGTGLGLAIVSAIVADHKGFIRVRENVPHGSRFILEFPVRSQPAQLVARARRGAFGS
ncbi:MAG TPA: ATP-binding protein [Candidatus Binatia bacterium]|jgi:two-component system nitrogen regulation sensor histidine kinase NtrY|nr:ATP-binding protein [Candidatus Binatia bacterium]